MTTEMIKRLGKGIERPLKVVLPEFKIAVHQDPQGQGWRHLKKLRDKICPEGPQEAMARELVQPPVHVAGEFTAFSKDGVKADPYLFGEAPLLLAAELFHVGKRIAVLLQQAGNRRQRQQVEMPAQQSLLLCKLILSIANFTHYQALRIDTQVPRRHLHCRIRRNLKLQQWVL